MKKLIAALLALASSVALAATTVPVQLINPTGSTAGQAIVSTGPGSAPTWGGVGVNGIAAIAANSLIGNKTNASAIPTAVTVTGCNGAGQALQWTNGTGFGCNSAIATSGANSNITGLSGLTSPVSLPGVTNGSNAAAGSVGEFPTPSNLTNVSLTTTTTANVSSVSLTAGDWDVTGVCAFTQAGTTIPQEMNCGVSTTSSTLGSPGTFNSVQTPQVAGFNTTMSAPLQRVSISTTTTVYLVVNASFTTSTMTGNGFLRARRIR